MKEKMFISGDTFVKMGCKLFIYRFAQYYLKLIFNVQQRKSHAFKCKPINLEYEFKIFLNKHDKTMFY